MTQICPACEVGALAARVGDRVIHFEGRELRVQNLHYSECPVCGEQVVLPHQSKQNEVLYADAKKAALGLWTCGRIEAFRKDWSLTQNTASKLFGGGANAFSKYERGEVIHSKSMDLLMRVFNDSHEARVLLSEYAGVSMSGAPRWRTIRVGATPRTRIDAASVKKMALARSPANNDQWHTEAAYGS